MEIETLIRTFLLIQRFYRLPGRYYMADRFTPSAEKALGKALDFAREMGHTYIGTEHLLLGILYDRSNIASKILITHGICFERTKELIASFEGVGKGSDVSASDMSPRTRRAVEMAAYSAIKNSSGIIGTEHILSALLNEPECVAVRLIKAQNGSIAEIFGDIICFENGVTESSRFSDNEAIKTTKKISPALLKYGVDLSAAAETGELDPVIGREDETECLIRILSRRTKNNPCLIGDPGVGKTAIAEGLANRIALRNVPEHLMSKKIVSLDLPLMIAGAKYRGEFEERMKTVIDEAAANPDLILFIDEIHTIVGAGAAEGSIDAANIIKPALARGKLRVIGATTVNEYRKFIEKDAALERRFQPLLIKEPSVEETEKIIKGLKGKYELHHGITISDEAITAAVKLSVRYIPDRYLPDKALDILDEAASGKRIDSAKKKKRLIDREQTLKNTSAEKERLLSEGKPEEAAMLKIKEAEYRKKLISAEDTSEKKKELFLTSEDIALTLSKRTGIPVYENNRENAVLKDLEERLGKRIFGQEEAIRITAKTIRRGSLGLRDPDRPLGSFIFLGPSGVGKTELARAISSEVFGNERELIKLDMSEYSEKHSIAKLIGSPPGYIGYGEEGFLTGKMKTHPRAVILFDEIEKAHPDIFGILLQILDDGFLTDSTGKKCDFRNTVIILTSNIGAEEVSETICGMGFSAKDTSENGSVRAKEKARRFFRPEFIGRFDGVIVFQELSEYAAEKIAEKEITEFIRKASTLGISVSFSDNIPSFIAKQALSRRYGARPIKKFIRENIEDPFISIIAEKNTKNGDFLFCDEKNGEIQWKTVTKPSLLHIM